MFLFFTCSAKMGQSCVLDKVYSIELPELLYELYVTAYPNTSPSPL